MIHYIKKQFLGYTTFLAYNEQNLTLLDFATTKSIEINTSFTDLEELKESYQNRIGKGYEIITRKEFNDALKKLVIELNNTTKEL